MSQVLSLRNVGRRYAATSGSTMALREVDLDVATGEFCAITGPSGSGKSTLLNLCALLDEPTTGTLAFDGEAVNNLPEPAIAALRKHRIGMVFQHYCLLPHRSVLENVLFRFRYINIDSGRARSLARDALAMVGLDGFESRATQSLSGGEMQRVGIARAIALRPRLLVADEPTGNLDSASATQVMDCLRSIGAGQDMAILLVTHDESLLRYATRHLRCHDGVLSEARQDVAVGAH
jgi:putative ABC transport system ATP-binding protein